MKLTRSRMLKGGLAAIAGGLALGGGAVVYGQNVAPTPRGAPGAAGAPAGGPASGICPMTGAPVGAMMGCGAGEGVASDAVLKQLGMTADQLLAERRAGKSLAQIAQAKGVSREALLTTVLEAHKSALADAVNAGRITQAQAGAMQAMMNDRAGWMVDQTTVGPGMMGGSGRGMMGGFGRGMMGGSGRGMMGWGR